MHPLGDGLFGCKPLYNQGFLRFNDFYLGIRGSCFFPVLQIDSKGKVKKTYPYQAMMTPYEKLKSLPDASNYLKPDISFKELEAIAVSMSDNEAVQQMNEAKQQLFKSIFGRRQKAS